MASKVYRGAAKSTAAPVKSEIEYPPSEAALARAAMISRMMALKSSSDALMSVISERLGAELNKDLEGMKKLTDEQDRLLANLHAIAGRNG